MKNFTYYILLVSLLLVNINLGVSAKLKSETEKEQTGNPFCPGIWSLIDILTKELNTKIARLNRLARLGKPLNQDETNERTKLLQEKKKLLAQRVKLINLFNTDCKNSNLKITPIVLRSPRIDDADGLFIIQEPFPRR